MGEEKKRDRKGQKDLEQQRKAYDEIIDELLSEKAELQHVAHEYQQLYEQVMISDENLEHLKNTIRRIIDLTVSEEDEKQRENIERFVELIGTDTLKTMQLLGFNYKQAIGEPLTEICSTMIYKKTGVEPPKTNEE